MPKFFLLAHTSTQPEDVRRAMMTAPQPGQWIFLGQSYPQFLEWKEVIGADLEPISLRQKLAEVNQQLRQPYLNLITTLGRRYNSGAWWSSRISERNTLVNSLFLTCCYLHIVKDLILKFNDTLCVVCEDWALLETLASLAQDYDWQVKRISRPSSLREKIFLWKRLITQTLLLFYMAIRQKLLDQDQPSIKQNQPCVAIHTYVDEGCLGENGIFRDRYYPGLSRWLEKNGYFVVVIPVLSNLKRSYASVWNWFHHSSQRFLNPFYYYQLSDYIFTLKTAWQATSLPPSQIFFHGLDVTLLFAAERQRSAFDCLQQILYLRLPKRLAAAGWRIDAVITEYENMIPEKLLILGFRKYFQATKIVGVQHSGLYPLLLCLFVTPGEAEFAPLPDRVVCNGEFFRNVLVQEGLPGEKAVVGPALRYAYLFDLARKTAINTGEQLDIFVPLPLMIDDGVELFIKLIQAVGQKELRVAIKPHPMFRLQELFAAAHVEDIPANFEFVEGTMADWLPRARVVITLSSGTIYESLAAGVPVVTVGREASIDFNPLGFYSDLNQVFYTPDQIYEETMRLLNLSPAELARFRQRSQEILFSSFNPVTEENMRFFLDGLI
jgi:hypothetical protein